MLRGIYKKLNMHDEADLVMLIYQDLYPDQEILNDSESENTQQYINENDPAANNSIISLNTNNQNNMIEDISVNTKYNFSSSDRAKSASAYNRETTEKWYNAQDIDKLLKHYLAANNNIECLPGIFGTDMGDKENRLFSQLQAFEQLQRKRAAYGEAVKDIVIIPVNLHQMYWAFVYISYPLDAIELPTIIYFDPLGGEVNNIVKQALSRLHRDVEINNLSMAMPSDDNNCGPWIVEAARNLAQFGYIPDFDYDIQVARREHEAILQQQVSKPNETHNSIDSKIEEVLAAKSTISTSPFSLFPQPKANHSFGKWYDAQDIDKLLNHYLAANTDIECLTGILGTDISDKENMLLTQLQTFEQQQRQRVAQGQKVKDIVIIPVNLYLMHWILIYIVYPQDATMLPTVIYFDPKGGEVDNTVKQALNKLHDGIEINNLSMAVQSDDDNCGHWIVEAARNLAELSYIPEADYDIQRARSEHEAILKEYPQQQTSIALK